MALVLSMRDKEDFFIGSVQFVIKDIKPESFTLQRRVEGTTKEFNITNRKMVEIHPQVMVSCGYWTQDRVARIVLEAPRNIIIMRGDKLRGRK